MFIQVKKKEKYSQRSHNNEAQITKESGKIA